MTDMTRSDPTELKSRAGDLAKDASQELAARANEKGAKGLSTIGDQLDRAAKFVEDTAASDDRVPAEKAAVVTDRLHGAATYLRETDPRGVLTDLDGAIQRHPYRAMAVGAAVGWVIGRLMSRD